MTCPLLARALQFYQHFQLAPGRDGQIHLPPTFSPEYPGPPGQDANYDISLYRWGLLKAVELAGLYPTACSSPHLETWKETLHHLAPSPIDPKSDTLEIYAGVPYGTPHRHYSHLFSIWPLHLLDVDNSTQFETARRSINLWLATPEKDSMFYRPAASAMNVLLGQRAAAFDNITYLVNNRVEGSTWYREGSQGSCTETPYAGAWAMVDWFVQSWNKTMEATNPSTTIIHFYPGVDNVINLGASSYEAAPARIATGGFWRMAAEGGILVSAKRALVVHNVSHFVTRAEFVAVEVRHSAVIPDTIVVRTDMDRPLALGRDSASGPVVGVTMKEIGDGQLVEIFGLKPGDGVALYSLKHPTPSFVFSAKQGCATDFGYWGSRASSRLSSSSHSPSKEANVWPCI